MSAFVQPPARFSRMNRNYTANKPDMQICGWVWGRELTHVHYFHPNTTWTSIRENPGGMVSWYFAPLMAEK